LHRRATGDGVHVPIRFTVEQRHLTDESGRPVEPGAEAVSYQNYDAESVDDALGLFVRSNHAELIGSVLKFPGFQAVATVRKPGGVYTIQFTPSSQGFLRP
jgi:hypothetical protein